MSYCPTTTRLTERMEAILTQLSTKQPHSMIALIRGLGMPKNGASSDTVKFSVNALLGSGLIEVNEGASDGTCTRWSITQDGLDALQASQSSGFVYAPTAAAKEVPPKITTGSMGDSYMPKTAWVRPGADDHKRCRSLMTGSHTPTNDIIKTAPEPIMVTKQIPAAPAPKAKRVMEDYSTPYKPQAAEVQTPKQPAQQQTTEESSPVAVTNVLGLVITDDPLPTTKAIFLYKYDPTFSAMKIGQSLKCASTDVGKIAAAMRKFTERKGIKAIVRSTPDYGDGMGRVWMLDEKGAA